MVQIANTRIDLNLLGCEFEFLEWADEILSNGKATSMFLLTSGAHDDMVERLIKNLFAVQLVYDNGGLAVAEEV